MTELPRDITDLYLAPVMLALDARIAELATLGVERLPLQVALGSDAADTTSEVRRDALLRTVSHLVEMHGWVLAWDDARGIRVTHDKHSLTLGIPDSFRHYVNVGG